MSRTTSPSVPGGLDAWVAVAELQAPCVLTSEQQGVRPPRAALGPLWAHVAAQRCPASLGVGVLTRPIWPPSPRATVISKWAPTSAAPTAAPRPRCHAGRPRFSVGFPCAQGTWHFTCLHRIHRGCS